MAVFVPVIVGGVWAYRGYQAYRAYRVYQMAKNLDKAAKAAVKPAEDAAACHDCDDDKKKCPKLREKPKYETNDAHLKRNPNKTPEPDNASQIFDKAVADPTGTGRTWWALHDGHVYRFSESQGKAHFNGHSNDPERRLEEPPQDVKKKLGIEKGKYRPGKLGK